MNWEEYGAACRERGSVALQVFACNTKAVQPGPPPAETTKAHLAYQVELEKQGKLFLAGPISDDTGTQMGGAGLIVYRAESIDEARALAEGDPMHREGVREFTLTAWRINEGMPLPGISFSSRSFDLV